MPLTLRTTSAILVILLAACSSEAPRQYSVCATDPGGRQCEIERYQNAY
jgi:hypothetical protein